MRIKDSLVTIITPHFRRLDFTIAAIKSVNRQKGIPKEKVQIIIVDEGYNAKTKQVLQKHNKNLNYFKTKELEGPGADRQTGLDLTKSEFVLFLDSDDQLQPTFLKEMIKALRQDSKAAAAICFSNPYFESGFYLRRKIKLWPLMLLRDLSLFATRFNNDHLFPSAFYLCQLSHMLFRKSALTSFKFNYDYRRGGEDWDLVVHCLKQNQIKVVHKKLLTFRYSPGSSTENPINQKLKWASYRLLAKRLPSKFKKGVFYHLFLRYIGSFKSKT